MTLDMLKHDMDELFDKLSSLSRKDLQAEAKRYGIKANSKSITLIESIVEAEENILRNSNSFKDASLNENHKKEETFKINKISGDVLFKGRYYQDVGQGSRTDVSSSSGSTTRLRESISTPVSPVSSIKTPGSAMDVDEDMQSSLGLRSRSRPSTEERPRRASALDFTGLGGAPARGPTTPQDRTVPASFETPHHTAMGIGMPGTETPRGGPLMSAMPFRPCVALGEEDGEDVLGAVDQYQTPSAKLRASSHIPFAGTSYQSANLANLAARASALTVAATLNTGPSSTIKAWGPSAAAPPVNNNAPPATPVPPSAQRPVFSEAQYDANMYNAPGSTIAGGARLQQGALVAPSVVDSNPSFSFQSPAPSRTSMFTSYTSMFTPSRGPNAFNVPTVSTPGVPTATATASAVVGDAGYPSAARPSARLNLIASLMGGSAVTVSNLPVNAPSMTPNPAAGTPLRGVNPAFHSECLGGADAPLRERGGSNASSSSFLPSSVSDPALLNSATKLLDLARVAKATGASADAAFAVSSALKGVRDPSRQAAAVSRLSQHLDQQRQQRQHQQAHQLQQLQEMQQELHRHQAERQSHVSPFRGGGRAPLRDDAARVSNSSIISTTSSAGAASGLEYVGDVDSLRTSISSVGVGAGARSRSNDGSSNNRFGFGATAGNSTTISNSRDSSNSSISGVHDMNTAVDMSRSSMVSISEDEAMGRVSPACQGGRDYGVIRTRADHNLPSSSAVPSNSSLKMRIAPDYFPSGSPAYKSGFPASQAPGVACHGIDQAIDLLSIPPTLTQPQQQEQAPLEDVEMMTSPSSPPSSSAAPQLSRPLSPSFSSVEFKMSHPDVVGRKEEQYHASVHPQSDAAGQRINKQLYDKYMAFPASPKAPPFAAPRSSSPTCFSSAASGARKKNPSSSTVDAESHATMIANYAPQPFEKKNGSSVPFAASITTSTNSSASTLPYPVVNGDNKSSTWAGPALSHMEATSPMIPSSRSRIDHASSAGNFGTPVRIEREMPAAAVSPPPSTPVTGSFSSSHIPHSTKPLTPIRINGAGVAPHAPTTASAAAAGMGGRERSHTPTGRANVKGSSNTRPLTPGRPRTGNAASVLSTSGDEITNARSISSGASQDQVSDANGVGGYIFRDSRNTSTEGIYRVATNGSGFSSSTSRPITPPRLHVAGNGGNVMRTAADGSTGAHSSPRPMTPGRAPPPVQGVGAEMRGTDNGRPVHSRASRARSVTPGRSAGRSTAGRPVTPGRASARVVTPGRASRTGGLGNADTAALFLASERSAPAIVGAAASGTAGRPVTPGRLTGKSTRSVTPGRTSTPGRVTGAPDRGGAADSQSRPVTPARRSATSLFPEVELEEAPAAGKYAAAAAAAAAAAVMKEPFHFDLLERRIRPIASASTGIFFKDVLGMDETKQELLQLLSLLTSAAVSARSGSLAGYPSLADAAVTPSGPDSLLLCGPSGMGKRLLSRALCSELGSVVRILELPQTLLDHGSEVSAELIPKAVRAIFQTALFTAPPPPPDRRVAAGTTVILLGSLGRLLAAAGRDLQKVVAAEIQLGVRAVRRRNLDSSKSTVGSSIGGLRTIVIATLNNLGEPVSAAPHEVASFASARKSSASLSAPSSIAPHTSVEGPSGVPPYQSLCASIRDAFSTCVSVGLPQAATREEVLLWHAAVMDAELGVKETEQLVSATQGLSSLELIRLCDVAAGLAASNGKCGPSSEEFSAAMAGVSPQTAPTAAKALAQWVVAHRPPAAAGRANGQKTDLALPCSMQDNYGYGQEYAYNYHNNYPSSSGDTAASAGRADPSTNHAPSHPRQHVGNGGGGSVRCSSNGRGLAPERSSVRVSQCWR